MDTMSRRIAELASQVPPLNINDASRAYQEEKSFRRRYGLPSDSDDELALWESGYFEPK